MPYKLKTEEFPIKVGDRLIAKKSMDSITKGFVYEVKQVFMCSNRLAVTIMDDEFRDWSLYADTFTTIEGRDVS